MIDPNTDPAAFLARELFPEWTWRDWRDADGTCWCWCENEKRWVRFAPEHDLNDAFALIPRLREWLEGKGYGLSLRMELIEIEGEPLWRAAPGITGPRGMTGCGRVPQVVEPHPAEALTLAIRDVVVAVNGAK